MFTYLPLFKQVHEKSKVPHFYMVMEIMKLEHNPEAGLNT